MGDCPRCGRRLLAFDREEGEGVCLIDGTVNLRHIETVQPRDNGTDEAPRRRRAVAYRRGPDRAPRKRSTA